jgi:hypothetical protein
MNEAAGMKVGKPAPVINCTFDAPFDKSAVDWLVLRGQDAQGDLWILTTSPAWQSRSLWAISLKNTHGWPENTRFSLSGFKNTFAMLLPFLHLCRFLHDSI